ncbi:MAG: phosphoribosylformylglycinamidine synthase subunit PurS [Candidatus Dadabacteria bacterium]|nr:phosphoribosylformylglycinamidine synthase subunit PurS [Candidatus Dadabacteria bacterium]
MSEYKVKVVVRLKSVVLDPQGKTVLSALRNLGFSQVQDTRVSKFIEMDVKGDNPAIVKEQVEQMCSKLLANPVIEDYEIEVME